MQTPQTHFQPSEYAKRQTNVREELVRMDLDGLLLFKVEDMYWLCNLDTDGTCIFHNMFIGVNGELTHVTRTADLANIKYSSTCSDVRIWVDDEASPKSKAIKDMLESHGMQGRRIGIQLDSAGLTTRMYLELAAALDGWCELIDASELVRALRLVKSPAELNYLRAAGQLMDKVRDVAIDATYPGAFEGELYGQIYHSIFANDCDPPAHRPPLGNGKAALNMRYTTGRKHIAENDQVTFELGLGYRHYHAADMFVVLTGPKIDERHLRMHEACVDALESIQEVMRPGRTVGGMFDAHREAFSRHGYEHAILNACGYTMGACWPPTWMEPPLIFAGNPTIIERDMTFFTHMILVDHDTGLSMSLGEQAIVTDDAPEIITHVPRTPIIKNYK